MPQSPGAFVTGATGFLGHHIVDVLLEAGWAVTAMVRNPAAARSILSTPSGLPAGLTLVAGDLTDPDSVTAAMPEGVSGVFHAAADTSSWYKGDAQQYRINVDGTEAVLRAMALKGAGRLIHVSSISVFGHHPGEVTEDDPHLAIDSWISYGRTKALGEARVQARIDEGFDAVIVNPTHIMGRYDTQNWARMILKLVAGDLPGIPPGSGNFANGRKVAEAIVRAHSAAPTGASYILGGPYATLADVIRIAGTQLGIKTPTRTTPRWLLILLGQVLHGLSLITGKRPSITREEADFASTTGTSSSAKAVRDLGYEFVPLEQSIADCIATLWEQKMLP